jgi:hypothetical protein
LLDGSEGISSSQGGGTAEFVGGGISNGPIPGLNTHLEDKMVQLLEGLLLLLLHFPLLVELLHLRQFEVVKEPRIDLCQDLELQEEYILELVVQGSRIDLCLDLVLQEEYIVHLEVLLR